MGNKQRKIELTNIIDNIPITKDNKEMIDDIKKCIAENNFDVALQKLDVLSKMSRGKKVVIKTLESERKHSVYVYPTELSNMQLEYTYMGLLLQNPEAIVKYYFTIEEVSFENAIVLNLYKRVLFTDGQAFAPEAAKNGFSFAKGNEETLRLEERLKRQVDPKDFDFEKVI